MDMELYNEEEAIRRRRQRIREAKRRKQKQQMIRLMIRKLLVPATVLLLAVVFFVILKGTFSKEEKDAPIQAEEIKQVPADAAENEMAEIAPERSGLIAETANVETEAPASKQYSAAMTEQTAALGGDILSTNAVLLDPETGTILAQKGANQRINPASMTKILTVLVAAELVKDLDDTFTITREITDYSYVNDCSNVGFEENEIVTIRDLFYGTILSSGADAAAGLAIYTAGSLEAFVELMNGKLAELGLSDTAHFTNCVGLYDENHYCTVTDMAIILQAALENELCRDILSARTYTTTATGEHPDGLLISNWFLRRIEDKDAGGEVRYGKTGYVVQSKNCAASYGEDNKGKGYICVTVGANSNWYCINDHVAIYKQFMR